MCLTVAIVGRPDNVLAQIHHMTELNTAQLRALDRQKTVVLLPGGILEQHGPYLPSFTDGYQNERLTQDLANAIVERPGWRVLIFPMIPLGTGGANEIGRKYVFDGTYAVRSSTLRAVFMDLAIELGEAGFRWIFVIHSHGAPNHNRALGQASDYFSDTYGGRMVHLLGLMPGLESREVRKTLTDQERQEEGLSVHAGMGETSSLLYLRPDLVDAGYKNAPPLRGRNFHDLVDIAKREDWPGYFGSPRLASAAYGARLMKHRSARVVELALKILDGLEVKTIAHYADVMKAAPANIAIDADALARASDRAKASQWLGEWLRRRGGR
jgi:creatinine amidohydrolase/Fe(II)-dependent formamide hydrolase-like protein